MASGRSKLLRTPTKLSLPGLPPPSPALCPPKPGSDLESYCTTSSPLPMLFPQPGQLPGVLLLSLPHLVQACFVDTPGQELLPRVPGHLSITPLQL